MIDTKALTITEHLPVKIDSFREKALSNQIRESTMEEERIATHLKNVTESLRSSIKENQKKRVIAAAALTQGFEMQPVSCEQKIEGDNLVTYRLDTGAVVRERALSVEEMREARRVKP
ncbi:MAG TPA: hypothetical protein VJS69_05035 [Candidatus Krumholzibacteria bacterium]|nr:hypothetical protein [Candidatus Krumholzibacteria bacterium]